MYCGGPRIVFVALVKVLKRKNEFCECGQMRTFADISLGPFPENIIWG